MLEYLKSHVAPLVIMILILLMIAALVVWLLILLYRKKKQQEISSEPEVPPEQVSAEETSPMETSSAEETEKTEEPIQSKQEEDDMKKKEPEKKPQPQKSPQKPAAAAKPAPAAKTAAKAAAKPAPAKPSAAGKWVLYEEDRGGFGFKLLASNGEVMLRSSSPYASLQSAKAGIKTYQDNIAAGRLEIVETKKGNFFVQINNASKRMLATSADYPTRSSCESALSSIKRWAQSTAIVTENDEEK